MINFIFLSSKKYSHRKYFSVCSTCIHTFMIIHLFPCVYSLGYSLQEELHQSLVKKRDERDHKAKIDSEGGLMRQQSMSGDTR